MKREQSIILFSAAALVVILVWSGCEPKWEQLKLYNNSEQTVEVFVNLFYPDTTLHKSWPDRHVDPHSSAYLATEWDLDKEITGGMSIFLIEYTYFRQQWNLDVGKPDTYLAEDSLLKKWILTRAELDSIDWELYYP